MAPALRQQFVVVARRGIGRLQRAVLRIGSTLKATRNMPTKFEEHDRFPPRSRDPIITCWMVRCAIANYERALPSPQKGTQEIPEQAARMLSGRPVPFREPPSSLRLISINERPLRRGETSGDLVGALDGIADNAGFRLELERLGRPRFGNPGAAAAACLRFQFSGKGYAFIERPQRTAEGVPQILVEREAHDLVRIGMADVTAVAREVAVVDFPHHAVTIRTGEDRSPSDACLL